MVAHAFPDVKEESVVTFKGGISECLTAKETLW